MAKAFNRFMTATDLGRNRKLRRKLTVPERWAFVAGVLCIAADAPARGTFAIGAEPATVEDLADEAGVTLAVATSALAKLRALGMLEFDESLGCERVHDWADYNPEPKADPSNATRQARWRERNAPRNAENNGGSNAPSNADSTSRNDAPSRALRATRPVSEDVLKKEERRTTPPTPPTGGRQRDRDQWEREVFVPWSSEFFPGVEPPIVMTAIGAVAGRPGPATVELISAYLEQWNLAPTTLNPARFAAALEASSPEAA